MPPRRIADRPDRKKDLKLWLNLEYNDPAKYYANMQLLKAVGLFAASVVVMRNFGDAFAI